MWLGKVYVFLYKIECFVQVGYVKMFIFAMKIYYRLKKQAWKLEVAR